MDMLSIPFKALRIGAETINIKPVKYYGCVYNQLFFSIIIYAELILDWNFNFLVVIIFLGTIFPNHTTFLVCLIIFKTFIYSLSYIYFRYKIDL